jgi:hypothetical protein
MVASYLWAVIVISDRPDSVALPLAALAMVCARELVGSKLALRIDPARTKLSLLQIFHNLLLGDRLNIEL